MKKVGATLAALGLFLMVAAGCGSSSSGVDPDTVRSKIQVGMTEKQVEDAIGKPAKTVRQSDSGFEETRMIYESNDNYGEVSVWLKDGAVTKVDTK